MKKLLITFSAAVLTLGSWAQISAFKQGNASSIEGYALPRTALTVTLVQERETVIYGPYARYASQYLGISGASLTNKESYKLLDASISYTEEPDPTQLYFFDEKAVSPIRIFNWLTVATPAPEAMAADKDFLGGDLSGQTPYTDLASSSISGRTSDGGNGGSLSVNRTSSAEKSLEQMAADAASVIFRIRKKRLDLITGEIGENVYGAGLEAALREMERLENEYIALFVGKRYTQVTTKRFAILPENGKNRVTICRFSDSGGIVPDTDISARPINVEFTVEKSAMKQPAADQGGKKATVRTLAYRAPKMVEVKLLDGQALLSSNRVPVYQMGTTVEAPITFSVQ